MGADAPVPDCLLGLGDIYIERRHVMTEREALKLAQKALSNRNAPAKTIYEALVAIKEALAQPENCEYCDGTGDVHSIDGEWRGVCVCEAGKALAQPEQEPVTWRYKIVDVFGRPAWTLKTPKSDTRVLESQPLYTTPPQRKPLTDEEIMDLCRSLPTTQYTTAFARAIEAAHGIKGEA